MKVKIKRLNKDAVIPKKAHATDAGFDLTPPLSYPTRSLTYRNTA